MTEGELEAFIGWGEEAGVVTYARPFPGEATRARLLEEVARAGPRLLERLAEPDAVPEARMFLLAACMRAEDEALRRAARERAAALCGARGEDVVTLARYLHGLGGWGRGTRRAVAAWYEAAPLEDLVRAAARMPEAPTWTHRDVLRLTHPRSADPARDAVLAWLAGAPCPRADALPEGLGPTYEAARVQPSLLEALAAPTARPVAVAFDIAGAMAVRTLEEGVSAAEAARALARGLAAASGGSVWVFTADGWGATRDAHGRASGLTRVPDDALGSEEALAGFVGGLRLGAVDPSLPVRRLAEAEAGADAAVVLTSALPDPDRARAPTALGALGPSAGRLALVDLTAAPPEAPPAAPTPGLLEVYGCRRDLGARLGRWAAAPR